MFLLFLLQSLCVSAHMTLHFFASVWRLVRMRRRRIDDIKNPEEEEEEEEEKKYLWDCVDCLVWLSGLGVWFALRVREVPGSNPGWAHVTFFYFAHLTTCHRNCYTCTHFFLLMCSTDALLLFNLSQQWLNTLMSSRSPGEDEEICLTCCNCKWKWKWKVHQSTVC